MIDTIVIKTISERYDNEKIVCERYDSEYTLVTGTIITHILRDHKKQQYFLTSSLPTDTEVPK